MNIATRAKPILLLLCISLPTFGQSKHPPAEKVELSPAMLVWRVGLEDPKGPDQMVETMTPSVLNGRQVWRVTHYSQDPSSSSTNDYDLYDLDRVTLAPLRSFWSNEGAHLEILFHEKEVTVRTSPAQDATPEKIILSEPVRPEGPGLTPFVASLPLNLGYRIQYQIIDRWDGLGPTRLKTVTLSVLKRSYENTALGKKDVYLVEIKPADNSFSIREYVLAKGPHFPVKVDYTRGKLKSTSEVTSMAISNSQFCASSGDKKATF